MRIYACQGCTKFILAAGHRKEILADYFEGRFSDWSVRVADTGENADTGERLLACKRWVSGTFFATYGDGLGNVNLADLLALHRSKGALATVTSVPLRSQYGTIEVTSTHRVERFQEKPVISNYWINAGFFVFDKQAFDFWEGTNLETDVLPSLARQGVLYSYHHTGFWKSMDTSKDQHELDVLRSNGTPPWMLFRERAAPMAAS
jgi:glucose-1-phosphate cytidylyltransferase